MSTPGASFAFMWRHPAHWVALGFGSGLSPRAPGTAGTLWAWLAFLAIDHWLGGAPWAAIIAVSLVGGVWACTLTAQHLGLADPGAVVWDEIVAFWIMLWVLMPCSLGTQFSAFVLFRFLDAVKRGPVGWADRLFKLQPGQAIGWRQGWGILFDDLVAALGALLLLGLWTALWKT